jgi:hypothetical protein
MTRNLIARVSRTLRTDRNRTASHRRRNAGLTLESLETRLALSSVAAAPVPLDLNPQPLPPGVVRKFNPVTPDIQGNHIGTNVAAPDIVGQHIGTGVTPDIVGQHIGTGVTPDGCQGCHIGYQSAHSGTSVASPSIIAIL